MELRDNLKWWDGKPVNGKRCGYLHMSLQKIRKVFTPYVENYRKVESVTAKDDKTIIVKYKEPYFKALEVWLSPLLPSHILSAEKEPMTLKFNFNPIGNGAYKLSKLVGKTSLSQTPGYFEGEAKIKKFHINFARPVYPVFDAKNRKARYGRAYPDG